ncbi:methyltransferase domain-containing protein [Nitratireductor sp. CAU 1489]|uniref:Methyltransferase domain-containing protein n=1 Tax=Nitratireductor arenosus TaxID=2682096 RepID=A0A844QKC0_9HYPH|nr:methyltransferase [Nitratireductor arenosus]MVA98488.1 methyltransferase domain-containing protein [Nitratireductor arenosus]
MAVSRFSSGDRVADRRADYASMLWDMGDRAAAIDLMADALALAPGWAPGWFRLGEMREETGELSGATEAWTEALRLEPCDRMGASLKLGLIGAAQGIEAAPAAFVETLFDQYADRFDVSLVEKLGYRVPDLIADALAGLGASAFAHVVDLGCGTGLMGERLRGCASFLEGNDISRAMLRKAEAKRFYDRLDRVDLSVMAPGARRADLVVAADVLIYLGALERIVSVVADMLKPDGLFAFSVELHDGPEPMVLRPSRRFAHAPHHVRALLTRSGFDLLSIEETELRRDRGEAVAGLILVARRIASADAMEQLDDPHAAVLGRSLVR